jgi:hypothetical protein
VILPGGVAEPALEAAADAARGHALEERFVKTPDFPAVASPPDSGSAAAS